MVGATFKLHKICWR